MGLFFLVTIEELLSNDFSLFGFGWKVQCMKLCKDFVDSDTDYLTFTYLSLYFVPNYPFKFIRNRVLFTGLISHAFASLCLSSFHFLSSPLVSVSFKYDTKRKCQLCSIWLHPQDICQHIQTRRGGAVIPHSCSLLDHRPSKKRSKEKSKNKIYPRPPCNSCNHPQLLH